MVFMRGSWVKKMKKLGYFFFWGLEGVRPVSKRSKKLAGAGCGVTVRADIKGSRDKSQRSLGAKSQSRGHLKTQQTAAGVFRAIGKNSVQKKIGKK